MHRMRLLAALFLAAMLVGLIARPPLPSSAQSTIPRSRLSACGGVITASLSANDVRLCDKVDVAVNLIPECPVCPNGINVVFVEVAAAFQAGWQNTTAVNAFTEIDRYGIGGRNKLQMAVIHYDSRNVKTVVQMTEQTGRVRGALLQPPTGHDPLGDVKGAAREALKQMDTAYRNNGMRRDKNDDANCDFIIFYASTKSFYTAQGDAMREAANMIHRENIPLFVGCPETVADYCVDTMTMPRTARNYTEAPEIGKMRRMARDQMAEFVDTGGIVMRELGLTQLIPEGLHYVEGSANITPTEMIEEAERVRLRWSWEQLKALDPYTVTYQVEPDAPGSFQIEGGLSLVDAERKVNELPMPAKAITVSDDTCLPTPTPTLEPSATPTATSVPTQTPTPTATASPTATFTPTPEPKPIYIPIVIGEKCQLQWQFTDVALVLDLSTSMDRLTRSGRSKLAATQDAAKMFVDMMDFTPNAAGAHDQVAIVGFNATAWIQSDLTGDAAAARQAVDDLANGKAQFTRLDLAFERGLEALQSPARMSDNTPVLIVLTDGLPNRVPLADDGSMETTVLQAAARAKAAGVRVYTIAIGPPEDTNPQLLGACASTPELFYYTADPEDLGDIYRQIAYSFGCAPDSFWGGR
ncbi:MAG: VWA domain-containing protein [Caldilineae bacterium]|nr:VWA domain-containing protein [Chloroflexota bacterium]MCB9176721.1 VWA domain-containing protein [Caldilineae bacterium]